MALADTLGTEITKIFDTTWNSRDGQVVPETDDVALSNGAVKLEAVFLYADLANSTKLARTFSNSMTAKIVRAYLSSMTRLIKANGGQVRSFDGDRVMGVFVGGVKHTSAAKCALQMKYTVKKILRPKAEAKFSSLKSKGFTITHCARHREERRSRRPWRCPRQQRPRLRRGRAESRCEAEQHPQVGVQQLHDPQRVLVA
jgi:adenylate cyclase